MGELINGLYKCSIKALRLLPSSSLSFRLGLHGKVEAGRTGWRELPWERMEGAVSLLGPPPGGSLDRTRWSDLNPLAQKVMIGSLNRMSFRVPYSKMWLGTRKTVS